MGNIKTKLNIRNDTRHAVMIPDVSQGDLLGSLQLINNITCLCHSHSTLAKALIEKKFSLLSFK